ncbi:hypothetical protein Syun_001229 [Stephania yunnanensis]|uniref:Uncharacterized protein n=1 Tax=Stephania yunnanensis TaxID=152371 RepID=A0AAP0Q7J3_9MAGN
MGGLVGFFINLAVENVAGTKFVITSNLMLDIKFMYALGSFATINLGLTLFSAIISPAMAGSDHNNKLSCTLSGPFFNEIETDS